MFRASVIFFVKAIRRGSPIWKSCARVFARLIDSSAGLDGEAVSGAARARADQPLMVDHGLDDPFRFRPGCRCVVQIDRIHVFFAFVSVIPNIQKRLSKGYRSAAALTAVKIWNRKGKSNRLSECRG